MKSVFGMMTLCCCFFLNMRNLRYASLLKSGLLRFFFMDEQTFSEYRLLRNVWNTKISLN